MPQEHTEISRIGEVPLIEKIRKLVDFRVDDATIHNQLVAGIGDDAAVFKPTPGRMQLLTTDLLVEGIHFDLTFTSLKHLGWKALAASISDIAAMGGSPRYALVSLCLPQKISVEMIEEFYTGMSFACKKYSLLVAGGDTSASLANMLISVTLSGEAEEEAVVYRSGAKAGDYLCVTGHLGASLAGLKVLQREKQRYRDAPDQFKPNLERYAPALEKHLMPRPRLDLARILTRDVRIHAMIDVSDGLATEVHHLCRESGTGALVYEHNLPVVTVTQGIAAELSQSPTDFALFGGEEYELLFTIDEKEFERLDRLTNDVTIVGRMTEAEKGINLVRENGEQVPLNPGGWDHFRK